MRRTSTSTLGHPGAVVMPGVVVMPLTAPDRLRMYRRCFHELEEQLVMLQAEGREAEVRILKVELRFLEELIMVFTELNPIPPNKHFSERLQVIVGGEAFAELALPGGHLVLHHIALTCTVALRATLLTPEVWMADAAVEGLDLSLVTDILMLSATSPWTVYIADRSQWLLCFVSPSVKRTTGWTSKELLGTAAWGACHSDDVPMVQRMLHLRDSELSGGSVIYRRLRKDSSYVTVQATGRAVGTRWYAWVEQDILNFSPVTHQEELLANQSKGVSRGPKLVEGDIPVPIRPRRQSTPWSGPPEVLSPNLDPVGGGNKPIVPVATASLLPLNKANGPRVSSLDEAIMIKSITSPGEVYILEPVQVQLHHRSQEVVPKMTALNTEPEQNGAIPAPTRPNYIEGGAAKVAKGKAVAQETLKNPPSSSSKQSPDAPPLNGIELLQGRKVLLAEDDAVNRKVGQRLLRSINCDVAVVCNGREALDVLCKVPADQMVATDGKDLPPPFDLVLMDLQMPVLDGTHAVQQFRDWEELQDPPRKRLTIFALTANVSDRDMVKCAQSGFDEFVSKPLTLEKLLERLKKINDDPVNNRVLDP